MDWSAKIAPHFAWSEVVTADPNKPQVLADRRDALANDSNARAAMTKTIAVEPRWLRQSRQLEVWAYIGIFVGTHRSLTMPQRPSPSGVDRTSSTSVRAVIQHIPKALAGSRRSTMSRTGCSCSQASRWL